MKRLLVATGLVAGAALAFQVLLFRLLAIAHFPIVASMVLSLALLGHGMSGTALSLLGPRARMHSERIFAASAAAFGCAVPCAWWVASRIPFNGLELAWSAKAWLPLSALYLVVSIPFFFAAACTGVAFLRRGDAIGAIYAADMVGAGVGAAAAMAALEWLRPEDALRVVACVAFFAFALVSRARGVALAIGLAALTSAIPTHELEARMTEFKSLPRALTIPGARVVVEQSGPHGLVTVVANDRVPLRYAPGRSLFATSEPAPQLAVFVDGDSMQIVTRTAGDRRRLEFLSELTSSLPFALVDRPSVVVLDAGVGESVREALENGARDVIAVDANQDLIDLARGRLDAYSGHVYRRANVRVVHSSARAFIRSEPARRDLIVLPATSTQTASSAGVDSAIEGFAFTVEAIASDLGRVAPHGLIAATRWDESPPRQTAKLLATIVAALERIGARRPTQHLVVVRSWQTVTIVASPSPLDAPTLAATRAFCSRLGFELVHPPSGARGENDTLGRLVDGLLSDRADATIRDYGFDIRPATDARPHAFHTFRWRSLPEILRLREAGSAILIDAGYLVVVASLVQAFLWSTIAILAPLGIMRRRGGRDGRAQPSRSGRTLVYFLAIGFGFLFVEVAFIERLGLFIGDRLVGVTATIAGFLVFAGLGSRFAGRSIDRHREPPIALVAWSIVAAIIVLRVAFVLLDGIAPTMTPVRVGFALALIAPLAFAMGMPFPIGMSTLEATRPDAVPWAWGVNGFASVASPLIASIVSIAAGVDVLLAASALTYLVAAIAKPR